MVVTGSFACVLELKDCESYNEYVSNSKCTLYYSYLYLFMIIVQIVSTPAKVLSYFASLVIVWQYCVDATAR